jgi:hypothetical protein
MTFFATAERKERTFGEWIAGVLGLWIVVEIHQVKKMVEGTKKGLMIEVHQVEALREYAEATQDDLSKLAKRILEQATFLWGKMEEISSKAAVNDALKPIRGFQSNQQNCDHHHSTQAGQGGHGLGECLKGLFQVGGEIRGGRLVHRA